MLSTPTGFSLNSKECLYSLNWLSPKANWFCCPLRKSCLSGTLFSVSPLFPQHGEFGFPLCFLKSYPLCFFEKLISSTLNHNIFFLFFFNKKMEYTCQNRRHRQSKVNYLLSVYILGLQVDFKSLDPMSSGLHFFPITKSK